MFGWKEIRKEGEEKDDDWEEEGQRQYKEEQTGYVWIGYIGFDIYLNFQQNKIKLKMKQNCHVSSSN